MSLEDITLSVQSLCETVYCCFFLLPSRDFSPNLKQDLSGLSVFFGQLRSKSCFKMGGLSGF